MAYQFDPKHEFIANTYFQMTLTFCLMALLVPLPSRMRQNVLLLALVTSLIGLAVDLSILPDVLRGENSSPLPPQSKGPLAFRP